MKQKNAYLLEANSNSAATPADKLSLRIEELTNQYTAACRRAAKSRSPQDNALAESLRQQIHQASQRFRVLTNTINNPQ